MTIAMLNTTKLFLGLGLSFCLMAPVQAQALKTNFSGCTEEKTVFFAYTQTHNNAVELCMLKDGYRFSYGPLKKPDTQILVKGGDAGRIDLSKTPGFAVKTDNATWWLDIDEHGQHDLIISRPDIHGRVDWAIGLESSSWGFLSKLGTWPLPPFAHFKK